MAVLGDAVAFAGLVGLADPLWVVALVGVTLLARDTDRLPLIVVALGAVLSLVLPIEWTILAALLTIFVAARAALRLLHHQR